MKKEIDLKKLYLKITEKDNIIVFFIIFLSIIGISLNVNIEVSDELWNFQNVYKLFNGFEIYKDANIICTPLFFYIGNIIFKILGANFFIFRIYNIIIDVILFFSVYILCKKMKMSKSSSLIATFFMLFMGAYTIILCMANYNILALIFFVIGVIIALKEKLEKKDFFIQGIIAFLIFFTKQNMGIYYFLALIFIVIIQNAKMKEKICNLSIITATTGILGIVMLLYLYVNGNLEGFINYTILGLGEFASRNISINISLLIIFLAIVSLNIYLAIILVKGKKLNNEQNIKILVIYSVFLTFSILPIMNMAHFCIGMFLAFIFTIYVIDVIIHNIFMKRKKSMVIKKIITIVLICIGIALSMGNFINWYVCIKNSNVSSDSPFYGGIIENEKYDKIIEIINYIKENENRVIVLSEDAALYMILLNRSNGKMDLPFAGNLGKNGEDGLIEELEALDDTQILIKKDKEKINWQESEKVREYIIKNFEYIGELEDYLIYYSR